MAIPEEQVLDQTDGYTNSNVKKGRRRKKKGHRGGASDSGSSIETKSTPILPPAAGTAAAQAAQRYLSLPLLPPISMNINSKINLHCVSMYSQTYSFVRSSLCGDSKRL